MLVVYTMNILFETLYKLSDKLSERDWDWSQKGVLNLPSLKCGCPKTLLADCNG